MGLENVVFIPSIPKAAMPQAVAAADVCVAILKPVPLYATVYPNKVFDYMAAGKPVVLAIEGVIRQVVVEAQAGIPVKPGDSQELAEAIRRLASDLDRREQMGANGRAYVQAHFDRAELAARLEALLLEMTA
jgi:glycosyltransferase involved in cell wall biosynthesis